MNTILLDQVFHVDGLDYVYNQPNPMGVDDLKTQRRFSMMLELISSGWCTLIGHVVKNVHCREQRMSAKTN